MYKIYTKNLCWPKCRMPKMLLKTSCSPSWLSDSVKKQVIMSTKATIVLLITTMLHVSAATFAQRVSLKQKDITVKQVFKAIKKQTGFDILYQPDKLNANKKLTVNFVNAPLAEVINDCLQGQNLEFVFYDNAVVVKEKEKSFFEKLKEVLKTPIHVKGKVSDDKGQPLTGVKVTLKGTSVLTSTDEDGKFSIDVTAAGDTLSFSFIGFATNEVKVTESNPVLNINMQESVKALNDVVIVGYGTQKKSSLTAAVSVVNVKDLENAPRPDVLSSLEGRVAGLTISESSGEPGTTPSVLVRGVGTIDGATSPLVIIDGVPNGTLSNLASADIASISVLKDAAAAAIYGARAANGVILVTTKQGGEMNKASLSYNSYFGLQQPTATPKTLDSYQYATLVNEAASNEGRPSVYTADDLRLFKDGGDPDMHANTNWLSQVLEKNAPIVSNYLSASGNSKVGKYFISGEYISQKGSVKVIDDYNRINLRANLTSKITDKLQLQVSTAYLRSTRDAADVTNVLSNALRASATSPVKFSDGHWGGEMFANGNYLYSTSNEVSVIDQYGPYANNWSNYNINANLEFKPIKGLTILVTGNYQASNTDTSSYNRQTQSWDLITQSVSQTTPNSLSEGWGKNAQYDLQATATYEKSIGNHYFKVLAGYSQESYRNDWIDAYRKDFINDELYELDAGDAASQTNGGGADHWSFMSGFGRINYSYKDKYLVEATARYDGSSRFADGHQWGFFPSGSVGWNIEKEDFMQPVKFLDLLKLRFSIGQLGNAEKVGLYESYANLYSGPDYNFDGKQVVGVLLGNPANTNLTWETTTTYNLGLDGSLFQGLIGFELDLWKKQTDNILLNVPVSTVIGLPTSSITTNAGKVGSHGYDLMVSHKDKFGDFSYNATFTISGWRSWVIDLKDRATPFSTEFRPGGDLGDIYGYQATGIITTQAELNRYKNLDGVSPNIGLGDLMYKDVNGDGRINYLDQVKIGNSYVKTQYGLNIAMQYKAFDMSLFFQGVANTDRVIGDYVRDPLVNYNSPLAVNLDRWTPQNNNANATFPRILQNFDQNTDNSSWWIRSGAFTRLKNVQIGYNVPVKALKIQSLRVYVAASNLFTYAPNYLAGFDPERDISDTWYPNFRVVSLGVNLKF